MKRIVLFFLLLNITASPFANPFVAADTVRINGKLALWLGSGMYWEDGFNYGWLLGYKIKPMFENYVIPSAFGGAAGYNQARQIFDQHFVVDEKYIEMAQGMIVGMEMAGIDLYSSVLNDTLNYKDVLIANSIPDFTAFSENWYNIGPGCSNLSSWGDATIGAPELLGQTVINRNLDWINNPHLINNALIIIWVTGDPSKQSFVTFGFIGLIGALSGMNEYGVATFQNMGNYMAPPTGTGFYPVNLAQRDGLEAADYNGDGLCTARDVTDAVRAHNVSSTFIVHSAGPAFDESSAEVLEIHNAYGFAIRTVADNPEYFGDNLVATNHFRLLKPPAYCYRYSRISDSLETSNQLDVNRNWNVLTAAGVTTNLQTIQFIPAQNIIRFSMAEPGTPAFLIPPTQVDMDSLFSMFNVGINEQNLTNETSVSIYPNPGKDQINIVIEAGENRSVSISISDLNGRKVLQVNEMTLSQNIFTYNWNSSRVPDGVYFANIDLHSRTTGKTMKVTKKVVIAR